MDIISGIYKKNIEGAPLHQFLGLKIEKIGGGEAEVTMPINGNTLNPAGSLHGGVIYLASDVAAFAAIGSILDENEFAVTIDIQCSVYKGTTSGPIVYRAKVTRKTRKFAFMNVMVTDGEGNMVAETRVTKAVTHSVPNVFKA